MKLTSETTENKKKITTNKKVPRYHIQMMVCRLIDESGLNRKLSVIEAQSRTLAARNNSYTGVSEPTLSRIKNNPNYGVDVSISKTIRHIYFREMQNYVKKAPSKKKFLVKYPKAVEATWDVYAANCGPDMKNKSAEVTKNAVLMILRELTKQRTDDSLSNLIKARAYWLRGKIRKDHALMRDNVKAYEMLSSPMSRTLMLRAADQYRIANALFSLNDDSYPFQRMSTALNEFQCYILYWFSKYEGYESHENFITGIRAERHVRDFRERFSNTLPLLKDILQEEPFQWKAARFGLSVCSIIDDREGAAWFYRRLVVSNKSFEDPNFSLKNGYFYSLANSPTVSRAREDWKLFS